MGSHLHFVLDQFVPHEHSEKDLDLDPEDEVCGVVKNIPHVRGEDLVDRARVLSHILLKQENLPLLWLHPEVFHVQPYPLAVGTPVH